MTSAVVRAGTTMEKIDNNANNIPPLPENWDRCHAYNKRKGRYCKQIPIVPLPGGKCSSDTKNHQPRYCGHHRHQYCQVDGDANGDGNNNKLKKRPRRNKKDRGKRVNCPIDPSHTIFESAIAKHILVCPAVKERQAMAGKDYFSEGINLGGFGEMGTSICLPCDSSVESSGNNFNCGSLDEAKELAYAVLRVFHFLFLSSNKKEFRLRSSSLVDGKGDHGTVSDQDLKNITERDVYNALQLVDLSEVEDGTTTSCDAEPANSDATKDVHGSDLDAKQIKGTETASKITTGGKLTNTITKLKVNAGGPRHLKQIASILGHVRQNGLISTNSDHENTTPLIIEMGAGRGMTGLVVAGAAGAALGNATPSKKVKLVLVEKSGTGAKAETSIRTAEGKCSKEDCLRLDLVDVTRIKSDLAHVDMSTALPSQLRTHSSKIVVIAKHLCGAGTDLALKSLRNIGPIDGCFMATCCHGMSLWGEYVGRNCLLRLFCSEIGGLSAFGEKEFNLLKRWTSASVLEDIHKPDSKTDGNEIKEEHNVGGHEGEKGRYSNTLMFRVVRELGLACGGKGLGRACQRLIDYGRCDFLNNDLFVSDSSSKESSFNVNMLHYVRDDVTPQNALLIASRD